MSCGLTDLATCLPQKFVEFITNILNAAIQPLLDLTQSLLTQSANINIFGPIWAIIIYIISIFYGLFFLFAGFNFIISGYDASKRERAKYWLQNVVLMMIAVQSSFIIYNLLVELGSLLTIGVIEMIPRTFFQMTTNNLVNVGLQFLFALQYVLILLITIILLALRYLLVVVGVLFFPFGLFFYFIPPLQTYGKLIINVLLVLILVPFFSSLILFGASALLQIPFFANIKIILAVVAFFTVDLFLILMLIFAIIKAAFSVLNTDVGRSVKSAVKYLA